MLCIYHDNTNPYHNLATEEYFFKNFSEPIFMLWRNESAIIVGKYQNTLAEINVDYVKENHIKVVRRITGGGAVFHDLGNLNYTFIAREGDGDFRTFSQPVIDVLRQLGVPATFEGRNDLMINGQKFSGNAQCAYHGRILHHGTLLFCSEISDLSAALRVDPLKFQDKSVKSVRKRVTNISEHLPRPLSILEFADLIMKHIQAKFSDCQMYHFTQYDEEQIQRLISEKYETWEWNFGNSPQYDFSKTIRTAGGNLQVNLHIKNGSISEMKISGDFFVVRDNEIEKFEKLFENQLYNEDNLKQLFTGIRTEDFLLNITNEDMLAAMF